MVTRGFMITPGYLDQQRAVALKKLITEDANEPEVGKQIIDILLATHSAVLRNDAALALADLKSASKPDVVKAITKLLSRDSTRNRRGTLLYVLDELNAHVPLGPLVDVIISDRYEAQEEALNLIEKNLANYRAADRSRAVAKLRHAKATPPYRNAQEWKAAISRAIQTIRLKPTD